MSEDKSADVMRRLKKAIETEGLELGPELSAAMLAVSARIHLKCSDPKDAFRLWNERSQRAMMLAVFG